ncbi:SMP-30/gluconolactonase/LRE family protein [Cecembia lonarensis]|uniref:Gluconolactonase n=1 Tax=Cecembia lonarensis (strain CCUG 58316 / KCTC 22772 / LW9) TaxID=1225176 RepID=K1KZJ8_CECL9|nr:SMP-30/gluconolactonase/LRE family protein [Cecembia lonarensis]EKB49600.1 Gluconolactonase precursor [Cecembia lonarensis LW9]
MYRLVIATLLIHLFLISCTSKPTSMKEDAFIEILDDRILDLLDPDTPFQILAEGFAWTEGPLWLEGQQSLLFTDIPNNSIFKIDEKGALSLFLKPSGYTGDSPRGGEVGANGLTLDPMGRLVLCQHGDRRMARMDSPLDQPKAQFVTLVDNYQGKRLNSPNDVVFDGRGNMYFTDPPYGLEFNMDDPAKELDFQGLYMLRNSGELELLDQLTRPNGLAFSPDQRLLYVANSDPDLAVWYVYEVEMDGTLSNRSLFYDATDYVRKEGFKGLPDGLKVHTSGIIFATGPGGVWVFDSSGNVLARLRTGEATSNCEFSTDEKSFFMTADNYVLKINLK